MTRTEVRGKLRTVERSRGGSGGRCSVLETGALGSLSIACTSGTLQPIQGHSESWCWGGGYSSVEKEGQLFKSCIISHTLGQESWFGQGGIGGSSRTGENDTECSSCWLPASRAPLRVPERAL